jgi:hypothetical protein
MARDKPVIWVKWKERYFCEQGWTCKLSNDLSGKSDSDRVTLERIMEGGTSARPARSQRFAMIQDWSINLS